jgi:prepilin-type processing-associated H-X9-DG protein
MVNTTVVGTMINTFWCPSDIMPAVENDPNLSKGNPYWRVNSRESNYLLSSSQYEDYYCPGYTTGLGTPILPNYRGAFTSDLSTAIADIKDGTSNTFLLGESVNSQEHVPGPYGPWWGEGAHTSTHGVIVPPTGAIYGNPGPAQALMYSPNGMVSWASSAQGPAYASSYWNHPFAWDFSSDHPGGLNMGMCDGSVRWIKNAISLYTWWALATIAGGEVIDASTY